MWWIIAFIVIGMIVAFLFAWGMCRVAGAADDRAGIPRG